MMLPPQAHIYPAYRRALTQVANDYRRYCTLDASDYPDGNQEAVGNLLFLHDDTLNIECRTKTLVRRGTLLLLLPIVESLDYRGKTFGRVDIGQVCWLRPDQDTEMELSRW